MKQLHPRAVWLFFIESLFVFFFIVMLFLGTFFGAFVEFLFQGNIFSTLKWFVIIFPFVIAFWVFISYIWAKLSYRFWRYDFTEDAIKIEKGVIWKKYISIPYERVQNVDIYRGILARIFKLSDLHIQTAGYSGYGKYGMGTEGRLPGLDIQTAEQLREELVKKVKGTKQGL